MPTPNRHPNFDDRDRDPLPLQLPAVVGSTTVVTATSPTGLRFRFVAMAAITAVAALFVFLTLGRSHHTTSSAPVRLPASAVSATQLRELATTVRHPVFWVGAKVGTTYELSRQPNGTIFVRYLPQGVAAGAAQPYLTVATYPFAGAYGAVEQVAAQRGSTRLKLPDGGLGVVSARYPNSVHVAYPGVNYQVEVYDPVPGGALGIVAAHELTAFGSLTPVAAAPAPGPRHVTAAQLRALAASIKHPVYWLGPRAGYTYELSQSSAGQLYVRYLPLGVTPGSSHPYLTVGTYPFPAAFGAIGVLAKQRTGPTLTGCRSSSTKACPRSSCTVGAAVRGCIAPPR